jgi:hypothetical protein
LDDEDDDDSERLPRAERREIVEFLYIPRLGLSSSIGVVSFLLSLSWDMLRGVSQDWV